MPMPNQGDNLPNYSRVQFDYSIISENEIEWYSSRRGCVHPYGLLVRILTEHQLQQVPGAQPDDVTLN